jgi:hypothetical protein
MVSVREWCEHVEDQLSAISDETHFTKRGYYLFSQLTMGLALLIDGLNIKVGNDYNLGLTRRIRSLDINDFSRAKTESQCEVTIK